MKKCPLKRSNSTLSRKSTLQAHSSLNKGRKTLKARPVSEEVKELERAQTEAMWSMFESVWSKREHRCSNPECRKWLGDELKSIYTDHILEKGTEIYKHLRYEEGNIVLVCWECHTDKGNGKLNEWYRKLIEGTKIKYGL